MPHSNQVHTNHVVCVVDLVDLMGHECFEGQGERGGKEMRVSD